VAKLESILHGGQKTIESRRFFRIPFSGRLTMHIASEIVDISEGGVRVLTNMAIKAGEIVTFELEQFRQLGFGEKSGKVVWVAGNDTGDSYAYQAGIDFIDLTDLERTRLRRWIFELHASSRK
jgi:c-di-GMP-binding flagellar brake protein YcgR